MKKRCSFLFILALTTAFTFYRTDFFVAMAAEQIVEPTAGSEADDGSAVETEPEANDGSAVETEPEANDRLAAEPEPEPEQSVDQTAEREVLQIMEAVSLQEPEESVSTGQALMEWLEAHKNTGGTVKLADHVVLDGEYCYCPEGLGMPAVYVDTNQYTVTVTGVIEFMSDNHLTFSGQPDGKGIFYVAEKGLLSLQGITVESGACALWQEEGAGLAVSGCQTAGSIHYAEMPFVIEPDPICVVVEKGQTVNDVLPECLCCKVNRQGEVSSNDSVPLAWNLEGTERQQAERLRFQAQGFFSQAASVEPVRCTVVYNDYPLTFAEVNASVYGNSYIFKGGYTEPEEESPYTLISEYSFDAENWLVSNEAVVDDGTYADFVIVVDEGQSARAAHPYIYIRLQRNDNGTRYFSNVLCYAADNLNCVEDIGGSRGGGTSIVDPPEKPSESSQEPGEEKPGESSQKPEEKKPKPTPDTHKEIAQSKAQADTDKAEEENGISDSADASTSAEPFRTDDAGGHAEQLLYAGTADTTDTDTERELYAEPQTDGENSSLYTYTEYAESKAGSSENISSENISRDDSNIPGQAETAAALSSYGEDNANLSHKGESALRTENRQGNYPMIAAGFVLLSAFAGAAGFCVRSRYSHSGAKR